MTPARSLAASEAAVLFLDAIGQLYRLRGVEDGEAAGVSFLDIEWSAS